MQILKTKDLAADKITCLIYGIPGMGKTTMLGMLKGKTLIVDIDKGTRVLRNCENVDVVRVSENLTKFLKFCRNFKINAVIRMSLLIVFLSLNEAF
ncbi:MAG: AAA family ATPase [Synergistaceae bacterium]|nr:AAA family ATPase [Synergistaceae bacterium]